MKKKFKPLCKAIGLTDEEKRKEMQEIVSKPKYFCKKCLRAASKKEYLCKPEMIKPEKKKKKSDDKK